jgi:hypothetical protein
VRGERRGEPYAGNPHVRFEEGPLVQAIRTLVWSLLHSGEPMRFLVELTRFGGRFRYAAFFMECISSNSIGL